MATRGASILEAFQRGQQLRRQQEEDQERLELAKEQARRDRERLDLELDRFERQADLADKSEKAEREAKIADDKRRLFQARIDVINQSKGDPSAPLPNQASTQIPGTGENLTVQSPGQRHLTTEGVIALSPDDLSVAEQARKEQIAREIDLLAQKSVAQQAGTRARDVEVEQRQIERDERQFQRQKELERLRANLRPEKAGPEQEDLVTLATSGIFGQGDTGRTPLGLAARSQAPVAAKQAFPFLSNEEAKGFKVIREKVADTMTDFVGMLQTVSELEELVATSPETQVAAAVKGGMDALLGQLKLSGRQLRFNAVQSRITEFLRAQGEVRPSDFDAQRFLNGMVNNGINRTENQRRLDSLKQSTRKSIDTRLRGISVAQKTLVFPELYLPANVPFEALELWRNEFPDLDIRDPEVQSVLLEGLQ